MPWGFMICTAMSGSGARTGTAITLKMTWLIRKDQAKVKVVCFVVVDGTKILGAAARRIVIGTSPTTVTTTAGCVSVSLSSEYFCQRRSEEHTSELQLLRHLVCRLLLE